MAARNDQMTSFTYTTYIHASAVFSAEGAPRLSPYPATAREWSSSMTVSQGLAARPG